MKGELVFVTQLYPAINCSTRHSTNTDAPSVHEKQNEMAYGLSRNSRLTEPPPPGSPAPLAGTLSHPSSSCVTLVKHS